MCGHPTVIQKIRSTPPRGAPGQHNGESLEGKVADTEQGRQQNKRPEHQQSAKFFTGLGHFPAMSASVSESNNNCPVCGVNDPSDYHLRSHKEHIEFTVPSEGNSALSRSRATCLTHSRARESHQGCTRSVGVSMRNIFQASQRYSEPYLESKVLPRAGFPLLA